MESARVTGRLATRKKCADQATQPSRIRMKKCGGMDGSGIWLERSKEVQQVMNSSVVSQPGRWKPTATAQACAKLAVPK